MRITIDTSTDAYADALRVLDSAYGTRAGRQAAPARAEAPVAEAKSVAAAAGPSRRPAATSRRAPSRRAASAGRPRKRGSRRAAATSLGDVRAWARGQGMSVSDRGRIPASVLSAYQEAHS